MGTRADSRRPGPGFGRTDPRKAPLRWLPLRDHSSRLPSRVQWTPRKIVMAALRRYFFCEGRNWRIPMGLGQGLRVATQPGQTASLHLYLGTAEAEIAPYLRRLVRPGTVCVDIGGNNAYYALIFAQRSGTEVVTLDFDPDAIALGTTNLALNPRLGALVRQHRCYVAKEIAPEHRADTLDHLLATGVIRSPGLLKIDVEGAEVSVLQGALQLLREHRPSVVGETHAAALETGVAEILAGFGYRVRIVGQRRWLREGRPAAHNRWLIAEAGGPHSFADPPHPRICGAVSRASLRRDLGPD